MKEYDSKDRLITKDDWEKWLKLKEEHSDKRLSTCQKHQLKKETKYAVIEWHRYPQEKPNKDDEYLVSVKSGDDILFTSTSLWIGSKDNFTDRWNEHISAWAELPEPYKGAKE